MASLQAIQTRLEELEQAYTDVGEVPQEYLSMAASTAMYAQQRTEGHTRASLRSDVDCLEPDHIVTAAVISELQRMAR